MLGNKHMLLACIAHPICSAAQPVSPTHRAAQPVSSSIAGFMKAWEKEKTSRDYQKRREISEKLTAERRGLKKAAHAARQDLTRARKIARAIQTDVRKVGGLWQWEKHCWATSTRASSLESAMNVMQLLGGINR